MKVLLVLCVLFATATAQIPIYGPWSPPACPASCVQNRSYVACAGSPVCTTPNNPFPINILLQQSCTSSTCALPTDWAGTWAVQSCYNGAPLFAATAGCCCLPDTVFIRQFDELVEITLPGNKRMTGPGCVISPTASAALGFKLTSPVGLSFKTPASSYPASVVDNTGTAIPGTQLPLGTTGDLNILGRTYRIVRTALKTIYIFGAVGPTGSNNPDLNPFCVHELTRVSTTIS